MDELATNPFPPDTNTPEILVTLSPNHRAELLALGCVEPGTEEPIDTTEAV